MDVYRVVLCVLVCSGLSSAVSRLKTYNVDKSQVSVSGISSGACMATQLHVIYSRHFMGAGIIAGVPFACSGGNLAGAMTCMNTPSFESVATFEALTATGALFGNVDPTSNMANDKVYIFAGTQDTVVRPGNGKQISSFYSHYIPNKANIKEVFNMPAQHSMPTENYGGSCGSLNTPSFLNNCGYNAAYDLLNHIYGGNLQKPTSSHAANGQLLTFDQTEVFRSASTYSMDNTGYIYVPSGCAGNAHKCKLHVALHGCKQGRAFIGDTYVRHAGYNEVGELNNIIILYPQAKSSLITNPNGCWDWWGYTGLYYVTNSGRQIQGIREMLERVMGGW